MDMELGMHTVYWSNACESQQKEETELGRESLQQSCPNQEDEGNNSRNLVIPVENWHTLQVNWMENLSSGKMT